MNSYLAALTATAHKRREAGLERTADAGQLTGVRVDLAGNDYLGLRSDARVKAAAVAAVEEFGTGAGASRLVTGTQGVHIALENELAGHLGQESALVFSTGYHANISAITALADPDTLIVSDAHNHASLIDGMRLTKARVEILEHGRVDAFRAALENRTEPRALIVVESIFSVLGDAAPLDQLRDLAQEFDALLIVDEAHGLGVVGEHGEGLVKHLKLHEGPGSDRIVVTVTLSKSLAAQGGAVLGPEVLREHLLNVARPFIFDTGLAPASAAAALEALRILAQDAALPARTRDVAVRLAAACGVETPAGAVLSVPMPSPQEALAAVDEARTAGLRIGCFRPPSTPDGISRLRLTAHANVSEPDLQLAESLLPQLVATAKEIA